VLGKRAGFLKTMRSHCGARVAPLPQFRGRNPKYKTAARVARAAVHNFKSVSCR